MHDQMSEKIVIITREVARIQKTESTIKDLAQLHSQNTAKNIDKMSL